MSAKVIPVVNKTLVFSFGSNSTKQLRARVQNPTLSATPAILRGYVRVFCFNVPSWGNGAVASLAPSKDPNALTHGAVVALSDQELELLDTYEGGYRKVNFTVSVGREIAQDMSAIAYVAGGEEEYSGAFTLPMENLPSEQYLWAIYGNLREHWVVNSIYIRNYDPEKKDAVLVKEWMLPESTRQLSLEALCVEISLRRQVPWVMPKTIDEVVSKLAKVNILNTMDLVTSLENSPDELNNALIAKELKPFCPETISVMMKILF